MAADAPASRCAMTVMARGLGRSCLAHQHTRKRAANEPKQRRPDCRARCRDHAGRRASRESSTTAHARRTGPSWGGTGPLRRHGSELGRARCQVWASRRSRMPYEFRPTAGKQVCENRGIVRTRHVRRGSRRRVTLLDLGRTRRDATVPVRADVLSRRRLRPRYAHGTRYGACLAVRRRLK